MQSLALISASVQTWMPSINSSNSTAMLSDPTFVIMMALCMLATGVSLLMRARRQSRGRAPDLNGPLATIEPLSSPHHALIDDLLHCARLVRRDGIASLLHPFNHSSDAEVAYAMNLVASHADPRIIRGVLLDRIVERTCHTSRFVQTGSRGHRTLTPMGFLVLLGSSLCVWQLARLSGAASPALAALAFALWCGGAITWLATSRRSDMGVCKATLDSIAMTRGLLILTAAELLAGGADTEVIEQKLRVMAGEPLSMYPISKAA
ncbi:MAG: hypothetical protein H7210_07775 [Pyrinomonadaceae bacterium]|nr:hypothetical protein [Phycisphaerales bacterium]